MTTNNTTTDTKGGETSESKTKKVPEKLVDKVSEKLVNKVPEKLVNKVPKKLVNKVPDKLVNKVPVNEKLVNEVPNELVNKVLVNEKLVNEVPKYFKKFPLHNSESICAIIKLYQKIYNSTELTLKENENLVKCSQLRGILSPTEYSYISKTDPHLKLYTIYYYVASTIEYTTGEHSKWSIEDIFDKSTFHKLYWGFHQVMKKEELTNIKVTESSSDYDKFLSSFHKGELIPSAYKGAANNLVKLVEELSLPRSIALDNQADQYEGYLRLREANAVPPKKTITPRKKKRKIRTEEKQEKTQKTKTLKDSEYSDEFIRAIATALLKDSDQAHTHVLRVLKQMYSKQDTKCIYYMSCVPTVE